MVRHHLFAIVFLSIASCGAFNLALAEENGKGEKLIQGFSSQPTYAFLGWKDKAVFTDGALRIKAPDDRGGCGYHYNESLSLTKFSDQTPIIKVTVGAANKLSSLGLFIKDIDGTTHRYNFNIAGIATGATTSIVARNGVSLNEPEGISDPGKQAGFDFSQIVEVGLLGLWSGAAVDITVHSLVLKEPTSEILAEKEKFRENKKQLAKQQEAAEAAATKRKQEMLAGGAPHPEDGPNVVHVGLVAPDILALRIQEKELTRVPQVPYEAKEGDVIKHEGKEGSEVWVVEDGKLQKALMAVNVYRNGANLGSLAVNAKCIKYADKVTGQNITTETVAEPSAYRIESVDDQDWGEPIAPSMVWWKRKPNSHGSATFEVQVFLKLPKPLVEGKRYLIKILGVNLRQSSVEYVHKPTKNRSMALHVSAIGFRPDDTFKRAFLSFWLGTGGAYHFDSAIKFHLLDDATGKSVFSGTTKLLKATADKECFKAGRNYSKTDVLALDFGGFKTPGKYRIYVEGIGCSYSFEISTDAWTKAFQLSMKGLLHHRSGIELKTPFTDYIRPRDMHPADGVKIFASKASIVEGVGQGGIFKMLADQRTDLTLTDAWGGHKDAGDWDRHIGHTDGMWTLVDLYERFPKNAGNIKLALPESEAKNSIPDILDEVLWNLDLYRRMQTPEGAIRGGIESTEHPRPGEASWQESLMLSAFAPDPKSSFVYAAVAAKLSRALTASNKQLSETYANSARKAWDWAVAHKDEFLNRVDPQRRDAINAGFINPRNLAAFELWRLTDDSKFHDEFIATFILAGVPGDINTQLRSIASYALLPDGKGDQELREKARQWVIATAEIGLNFADNNAFGLTIWIPAIPPMGWVGYFSTPETGIGALLPYAWMITHDQKYLSGAVRACQFAAGANPDNRAMTTGLGPDPIRFPLHIDSAISGQPVPAGITVYGISDPAEKFGFDNWAYTWFLNKMVPAARTWPANESYWDIYVVPSTNEYTIQQTIIPTAFYWGFLAMRPELK